MIRSAIIGLVVIAGVYLGTQKRGTTSADDKLVTIAGFAFGSNIIIVHVVDTVTWKNNDGVPHTCDQRPELDHGVR